MVNERDVARDPLDGTRYRALQPIGRGALADVLLIEHRATGRKCVAKILRESVAAKEQLADRMRLEAQILGRLRHANIVNVVGASVTAEGRPFIVLERLTGRTLREALDSGPIAVEDGLRFIAELLSALVLAHSVGIVHRDIKPSHLFLAETHRGIALKVLDFGVARVLPSASPEAPQPLAIPTDTGALIGTPGWLSPEALRGEPADEQADLFAVGLTLYDIVVGRQLASPEQGVVVPPSELVPDRSFDALDAVLARALAPIPGARFVSAAHFLEEVALLRGDFPSLLRAARDRPAPVVAARPVPPSSTAKTWVVFVGAAIVTAASALLIASWL